jgi:hypothetical protein
VDPAGLHRGHPGQCRDYGAIEQRILADAALFQVREIAYDPWNATHIALRLQDESAKVVEFRQGFRSMAAPTRELEKLIVSRKLAHGGNPVTRWMAANVAVAQESRRQPQARQGQEHRADGWHRRRHHGHRPRHGRTGRATTRLFDVLCVIEGLDEHATPKPRARPSSSRASPNGATTGMGTQCEADLAGDQLPPVSATRTAHTGCRQGSLAIRACARLPAPRTSRSQTAASRLKDDR